MKRSEHWNEMYTRKTSKGVSWHRAHLETSLAWIQARVPDHQSRIIDVGGGASTLVDDLSAMGYRNLSILDISNVALNEAKSRLPASADGIVWIEGDITSLDLPADHYDLWHDRASFHFLADESDRKRYVNAATRSVRDGGFLIVATFATDGPSTCSGLPVTRYSSDSLVSQFAGFEMLETRNETHQTPWDATQSFVYCLMKKHA